MSTFESLSFFRGVSRRYPKDKPSIQTVRKNRSPRNSPLIFHKVADAWFRARFGLSYRSESLFVTSRVISAAAYAEDKTSVVRIIPISPYRFCWSPNVSDLLFAARRLTDRHEIESFLDKASYSEQDLNSAHASGNEVMVSCERYVAIPLALLPLDPSTSSGTLILPN
jgi:hypothetical protein